MNDDLDLYGRGSTPRVHVGWRKVLASGLVMILLLGFAGYRWMTSSTPVSQQQVLDIYRAQADTSTATAPKERGDRPARRARAKPKEARRTGLPATAAAPQQSRSAATGKPGAPAHTGDKRAVEVAAGPPQEGVYSWDTEGYEEAGGARRSLPEESQRIITHERGGWEEHHYFSEQRESWTTFQLTDRGAAISYQRNKVVFGPVTNDSVVDFAPPMLVGPRALEVGQTWEGSWEGKTYGTYEGKTFERVVLTIGGTKVEAFGVQVDIHLRGEQRGEVIAQVWIAPEYSMTVKEHFVQDVQAPVGNYHAEWTITLKSLEPRR